MRLRSTAKRPKEGIWKKSKIDTLKRQGYDGQGGKKQGAVQMRITFHAMSDLILSHASTNHARGALLPTEPNSVL